MSEKPRRWFQFSLRQFIAIVMSSSCLFGLTFRGHNGGFTPGEIWVANVRGESAPVGEKLWGNFDTFGFPFSNFEQGATWYLGDPTESSVRLHFRYCYAGIVFNVIFWFGFSCALVLGAGRVFRRREARKAACYKFDP